MPEPDRYQTVYANEPASAAAPTAGLHFTPELLAALAARGVEIARVELVVGLDTFKPVSVDDPSRAHDAQRALSRAAEVHGRSAAQARRVVAVGTTSVRALESAALGRAARVAPICSSTGRSTGRSSTC